MPLSPKQVSAKEQIGKIGEALAAKMLSSKGYKIIALNWRCSRGEIDIIALDQGCYVFVEVRTRRAESTEAAFASVRSKKQQRLIDSSRWYCSEYLGEDTPWRIDVVAVALPYRGSPVVDHVENALDW